MVSECDLQDLSIMPLLNALHVHKTIAMLDLSHNMLGNVIWFHGHMFSDCDVLVLDLKHITHLSLK